MCYKVELVFCIKTVKSEATGNAVTRGEGEKTIFFFLKMLIFKGTFQNYLMTFTLQLTWDQVLSTQIS